VRLLTLALRKSQKGSGAPSPHRDADWLVKFVWLNAKSLSLGLGFLLLIQQTGEGDAGRLRRSREGHFKLPQIRQIKGIRRCDALRFR
jgi:hypothetical protein